MASSRLTQFIGALCCALALGAPSVKAAEKKYDPGASDTEIKLGQTVPYSGPASAFSSHAGSSFWIVTVVARSRPMVV